MSDPTGTSRPGVSVTEASVMLGISPNTVRRWVAAGHLRSERVQRPQEDVIRVFVDQDGRQVPTGQEPGDVPIEVPVAPPPRVPDTVRAEAMASLISAAIVPVLAPLVAQIDAQRQAVERQADRIAELEREAGRYAAERDAAEARYSAILAAQSEPASFGESPALWLRRLWPLVLVVAGAVVLVLLLVWPR